MGRSYPLSSPFICWRAGKEDNSVQASPRCQVELRCRDVETSRDDSVGVTTLPLQHLLHLLLLAEHAGNLISLVLRDENENFCFQSHASRREREFLLSVSFFETRISVLTLVLREREHWWGMASLIFSSVNSWKEFRWMNLINTCRNISLHSEEILFNWQQEILYRFAIDWRCPFLDAIAWYSQTRLWCFINTEGALYLRPPGDFRPIDPIQSTCRFECSLPFYKIQIDPRRPK